MPRQMHPNTLAKLLADKQPVYLLDVREPWEHAHCQLPDSVLIPLGELPARIEEMETAKDARIVVYCHHGIRSLSAAGYLQRLGFINVKSLAGGIDAWSCEIDPNVPRY